MDLTSIRGGFVVSGRGRTFTFKALVADARTEGEIANGVKPSYQIVAVNNATGKLEVVKHPNGATRFRFDPRSFQDTTERRILDFNAGVAELFGPQTPSSMFDRWPDLM